MDSSEATSPAPALASEEPSAVAAPAKPGNVVWETVRFLLLATHYRSSLTFTGSMMAFGKLQGWLPGAPITYKGQNLFSGLLLAAIQDPDPVVFLEPSRLYRRFKEEVEQLIRTLQG